MNYLCLVLMEDCCSLSMSLEGLFSQLCDAHSLFLFDVRLEFIELWAELNRPHTRTMDLFEQPLNLFPLLILHLRRALSWLNSGRYLIQLLLPLSIDIFILLDSTPWLPFHQLKGHFTGRFRLFGQPWFLTFLGLPLTLSHFLVQNIDQGFILLDLLVDLIVVEDDVFSSRPDVVQSLLVDVLSLIEFLDLNLERLTLLLQSF